MCRMDTKTPNRTAARLVAGLAFLSHVVLGNVAWGQIMPGQGLAQPGGQSRPEGSAWRKLGNHSVGLNLAGPAGGPIDSVWFSPVGDRLYVRTRAGQVLETADFSNWA